MKKLTNELNIITAGFAHASGVELFRKEEKTEEPVMEGSSGRLTNNSISFTGNVD